MDIGKIYLIRSFAVWGQGWNLSGLLDTHTNRTAFSGWLVGVLLDLVCVGGATVDSHLSRTYDLSENTCFGPKPYDLSGCTT